MINKSHRKMVLTALIIVLIIGCFSGITASAASGAVPVLKVEKQTIALIGADNPGTARFSNINISEITITVRQGAEDAKDIVIEISELGANPADTDPSGTAYKYVDFKNRNMPTGHIDVIDIRFKVENSWIDDNNMDPATVKLSRYYREEWTELNTSKVYGGKEYTYFDAKSVGLTELAITGEPDTVGVAAPTAAATEIPTATPTATTVETATPVPTATLTATPTSTPIPISPPTLPSLPFEMEPVHMFSAVAVLLVAIVVTVIVLRTKPSKDEMNLGWEIAERKVEREAPEREEGAVEDLAADVLPDWFIDIRRGQ